MLLVSPAYENFPYAHLNENALRPPSWGIFYFGSSSDCVGWGNIVLLNEIYRTATFMSRLCHIPKACRIRECIIHRDMNVALHSGYPYCSTTGMRPHLAVPCFRKISFEYHNSPK